MGGRGQTVFLQLLGNGSLVTARGPIPHGLERLLQGLLSSHGGEKWQTEGESMRGERRECTFACQLRRWRSCVSSILRFYESGEFRSQLRFLFSNYYGAFTLGSKPKEFNVFVSLLIWHAIKRKYILEGI